MDRYRYSYIYICICTYTYLTSRESCTSTVGLVLLLLTHFSARENSDEVRVPYVVQIIGHHFIRLCIYEEAFCFNIFLKFRNKLSCRGECVLSDLGSPGVDELTGLVTVSWIPGLLGDEVRNTLYLSGCLQTSTPKNSSF